ncbi:MAG: vanadium-dependent haloperoxidase [Pirellulales bacterium]
MIRNFKFALFCLVTAWPVGAAADVVTDWNSTLRKVIKDDGTANSPARADPGWSTRAATMMNTAMYDAFQSVNRTHKPFLYTPLTPGASETAAAAQAAHDVLLDVYPLQADTINAALTATLTGLPNNQARLDGIQLGMDIALDCVDDRFGDGALNTAPWPEGTLPGEWRSDPLHFPQTAWGPLWGVVKPFTYDHVDDYPAVPGPPELNSAAYTTAFNQVKQWGAVNSASRAANPDTTEIALFWAYDRPAMGPPVVLFVDNLEKIAEAVGTTAAENARMFAMASVASADAAVAAWDVKFDDNIWRPISAIRLAGTGGPGEVGGDGNDDTVGDPNWAPLGAPGNLSDQTSDDFTPPFPAYTSGHATMGSAWFNAVKLFLGTNDFHEADGNFDALGDSVEDHYTLTSEEFNSGPPRDYVRFIQDFTGDPNGILDLGEENSPEGENAASRVYMGVHWIFDQVDGMALGRAIADHVHATRFQAVPEPAAIVLAMFGVLATSVIRRARA